MNRRTFLKSASAGAILAGTGFAWSRSAAPDLPILPMTDLTKGIEGRVALNLVPSTHDFGNGAASDTLGINSAYLGPVVRAKQGQTLPFDVANGIGNVATIHWHGLHIPGDVDGGPHQEIEPSQVWSPDVPIVQRTSMNWFHSHMHGKTAQQTYNGLAGVMLVEDDASLAADLPQTYGVDDFTLVLRDKMSSSSGEMSYDLTGQVFEDGFEGDTLIVNGAIAPVAQAAPIGLVRLRILNACNARFLRLSLADGPLTVIASDGGFLGSAVETKSILMPPGERYEVLVDLSRADAALMVDLDGGGSVFDLVEGLAGGRSGVPALFLNRTAERGFDGAPPRSLAVLPPPDPSLATVTRSFQLNMGNSDQLAALTLAWGNYCGSGGMAIDDQPVKMDRIDEEVRKGDTEIWRIAVDEMLHPFHIHGCSFHILKQNGSAPPAYASGWKDMVHVEEGWSEVLVKFDYTVTKDAPYMYHCHILEHEDCGMMGQFTVT